MAPYRAPATSFNLRGRVESGVGIGLTTSSPMFSFCSPSVLRCVQLLLTYNTNMAVLAIVDDLFFRTKIEAAAAQAGIPLVVAGDATAIKQAAGRSWQLVILDLHLSSSDPFQIICDLRSAHPALPMVSYYPHVETHAPLQATQAGCTLVLPRSAFIQRLPELLCACSAPSSKSLV